MIYVARSPQHYEAAGGVRRMLLHGEEIPLDFPPELIDRWLDEKKLVPIEETQRRSLYAFFKVFVRERRN